MKIFTADCLSGGTYLVTGASSGIGRVTAELIALCGGRLIVCGRDKGRLTETLGRLAGRGEHHLAVNEFRDADQTAEWLKELAVSTGPWAGIFHAAGEELVRPARMTRQEHLEKLFGGSLYAGFGIARAASQKGVMAEGSSIVFMSSVAGLCGQVGMTAYSAAKAGIDGLVRSLACELAPMRIRVNSIAAGAVKTAMHERLIANIELEAINEFEHRHLLGFGEAADVANIAVFLLSPAARWITGSTVVVDGGYLVR